LNNYPSNSTGAKKRPKVVPIIRILKCLFIKIIKHKCTFTCKKKVEKGENVTKLEKFQIKQVKNKKNFEKNVEEGIIRQITESEKFGNKY
jgi:hypothetical protein